MTLKLITEPATEPVTLTEAKAQLRVTASSEDDAITGHIVAAREAVEHILARALITQTWERILDAFPCAGIRLGMPPVQSIVSITYIDAFGASQVLDPANYTLDADTEPGYVLPSIAAVYWPATLDTVNAVRVRFTCGFGTTAASVPSSIRRWMLKRIATLHQVRSEIITGVSVSELSGKHMDGLLDRYRRWTD